MTKVDDNSPPVRLDEQARGRLTKALDRPEVAAAYLFGSQATGTAGPLSDADVAVLVEEGISGERRFDLHLELVAAAAEALRTRELDLVILNEAPPLLRHRILRDGVLLLDRSPRERLRFQTGSLLEYFDTQPLREELSRGLRNRIDEGRFGRP
jgi:uncharacterized protein